jgi:hypothetical protein
VAVVAVVAAHVAVVAVAIIITNMFFQTSAAAATSAAAVLRLPPPPEELGGAQGRSKRARRGEEEPLPVLPVVQLSSSWCVCIECSSSSGGSEANRMMAHDMATIKGAKVCGLRHLSQLQLLILMPRCARVASLCARQGVLHLTHLPPCASHSRPSLQGVLPVPPQLLHSAI